FRHDDSRCAERLPGRRLLAHPADPQSDAMPAGPGRAGSRDMARARRLLRDNGIDPAEHWLVEAAMSDSNEPAFFPLGAPGAGSQNCVSTNHPSMREAYVEQVIAEGRVEQALQSLLLRNSTGLHRDLA